VNRLSVVALAVSLLVSGIRPAVVESGQRDTQVLDGGAFSGQIKDAIASGACSFRIPPGSYRLATGLQIEGANGFTLEGQDATLIFTPGAGGLRLEKCTECVVKGLALDLDPLPYTQGTIVAVNPAETTFDIRLDDGYPDFVAGSQAALLRCVFFEPSGTVELGIIDTSISKPVEIGARVYRATASRPFDVEARPLQPGDRVVVALGRPDGGLALHECSAMRVEDVTVFASGGMAIVESGFAEGGHVYERCRVVRRPGSGRLMASASDGLHSMTQRTGPTLRNCEISHCFDDLVNIHGFLSFVLERRENGAWIVAGPAGQDFSPGSLVRFYRSPDASPAGEARILSCEPSTALDPQRIGKQVEDHFATTWPGLRVRSFFKPQSVEVRFDREDGLSPYDFMTCGDFSGAGALIEDCFFHDGHVRGILLKSSGSTVARCRFERLARSGIVVAPELYWLEGPFPDDVRIVGNTLSDCGFGSVSTREKYWEFAPLMAVSGFADRLFPPRCTAAINMSRLDFIDNRIVRAPGPGILVMNAQDVTLSGNSIVSPGGKPEARATLDLTRNLPERAQATEHECDAMRDPAFGIFLMAVRRVHGTDNRVEGGRGLVGKGWAVEDADLDSGTVGIQQKVH